MLEVEISLSNDSDYEEFKEGSTKVVSKKKYTTQEWKKIETIPSVYYQKYVDLLLRQKTWLYKAEYSSSNYYVLKCAEGINCQYRRRITVQEEEIELPEHHCLKEIANSVFDGKIQKLVIEENNKSHQGHFEAEELKKKFEERSQGCSGFAKILIKKMELYMKKQIDRISTLKKLLGNSYDLHVPSSHSLSNCCFQMKKELHLKDFDDSLGSFQDLLTNFSYEKATSDSDLIILDINMDIENFTWVFSCKHFSTHFKKQEDSKQPSFFVSDTTFCLLKNINSIR